MRSLHPPGGAGAVRGDPASSIDGRRVIAIFKFVKAFFLILTSYGVHKLLDPRLIDEIRIWSATLTDRDDQRFIERALSWIEGIDASKLYLVMTVTIAYTAVVLAEGTGLWLRRRWGDWVTLMATCSLIPIEIYELLHRPSGRRWTVAVTLLVNVLIAIYLALLVRARRRAGRDSA